MNWVDRGIPLLNSIGAATAIYWRVRAAYKARLGWAPLHLAIAGFALFFAVAYAMLWTGAVSPEGRGDWSRWVAIVSAMSWFVVWGWPARKQTKDIEHGR